MATFVVTYDLSDGWVEVKNAAKAAGFYDCVTMNDRSRRKLPNTTLFIEAVSGQAALQQFVGVVEQVNRPRFKKIVLEKIFVSQVGDFWLNSNESC